MEQKLTQLAILLPSSLHSIASPHFFPFLLLWHALHGLLLALQILYSLQLCVYLFPNAPSSFFPCHKLEKEERGGRRREEGLLFPRTQSVRQSGPPTARCQRCRRQPPGPLCTHEVTVQAAAAFAVVERQIQRRAARRREKQTVECAPRRLSLTGRMTEHHRRQTAGARRQMQTYDMIRQSRSQHWEFVCLRTSHVYGANLALTAITKVINVCRRTPACRIIHITFS